MTVISLTGVGIASGNSFWSIRNPNFIGDGDVFTVPFDVLPERVAPINKQLRVVVNGVEYDHEDDATADSVGTWTFAAGGTTTTGVPCWGFEALIDSISGNVALADLAIFDSTGAEITLDPVWIDMADNGGLSDGAGGNAFVVDRNAATGYQAAAGAIAFNIFFPRQFIVSSFAWSKTHTGTANNSVQNITLMANTGSLDDPVEFDFGERLGIVTGDYPAISTPIDPLTEMIDVDAASGSYEYYGTITIDPPISGNDRLTVFRETRQDKPWVQLKKGARGYGPDLYYFWQQLLFILQEICEYWDLGQYIDLPPATETPEYDYTIGNQMAFSTGGSSRSTIDYSSIDLLIGIPGAPSDPVGQLVVEQGNQSDGSSTIWFPMTYDASPSTGEFSVNATTKVITIGVATTKDLRVRRSTKLDSLWADTRINPVAWNSGHLLLNQRQIRYLFEESCRMPSFYRDSLLGNPIYPRAWNFLVFAEGGEGFTFGGPFWGGDGSLFIWDDDTLLVEGVDYIIVGGGIQWLIDPDGPITVGGGGGGFGGASFPDDDEAEEPAAGAPVPVNPAGPEDWPGVDLTDLGFHIEVTSRNEAWMETPGNLEAGDPASIATFISQANAIGSEFNDHVLRFKLTVTRANTIPNGVGGYYPIGAAAIGYVCSVCSGNFGSHGTLYWVYTCSDPTGSGTFGSRQSMAQGGAGCAAAQIGPGLIQTMIVNWDAVSGNDVGSASPASLRLLYGTLNYTSNPTDSPTGIPYFNQWAELSAMSGNFVAEGGSSVGFTDEQWQDFIDPTTDFDDFDIP